MERAGMTGSFAIPPQVLWPLTFFAFAFGCCVGSYLNVVIYRLPLGMKTSEPRRSFCPACRYQIPLWHNIPVFSWLLLFGKCANCRAPISPRYLVVEFLTGLLFVAALWHLGFDWKVLAAWTFLALAVAGSYIDIDHQILPHEITWGGAVAGVAASLLVPGLIVDGSRGLNLLHALGGAALGYGLIYLIVQLGKAAFGRIRMRFDEPEEWSVSQPEGAEEPVFAVNGEETAWGDIFGRESDRLLMTATELEIDGRRWEHVQLTVMDDRLMIAAGGGEAEEVKLEAVKAMRGKCTSVEQPREAMGLGDANWMACVGAFFGWKAVLFTIFAGAVIGSMISLSLVALKRREWAGRVPFGPYLAAGAVLWLFFGQKILSWYLGLRAGGGETAIG
jgi:leader peptidase (prepilin peptidase)/N-methyltransferase